MIFLVFESDAIIRYSIKYSYVKTHLQRSPLFLQCMMNLIIDRHCIAIVCTIDLLVPHPCHWLSCLIALILSSSADYCPLIVSSRTKTAGLCAKKLFLVSVSSVRSEICAGRTKHWANHYSVVVRWSLSWEDSLLFIRTPRTSVRRSCLMLGITLQTILYT